MNNPIYLYCGQRVEVLDEEIFGFMKFRIFKVRLLETDPISDGGWGRPGDIVYIREQDHLKFPGMFDLFFSPLPELPESPNPEPPTSAREGYRRAWRQIRRRVKAIESVKSYEREYKAWKRIKAQYPEFASAALASYEARRKGDALHSTASEHVHICRTYSYPLFSRVKYTRSA